MNATILTLDVYMFGRAFCERCVVANRFRRKGQLIAQPYRFLSESFCHQKRLLIAYFVFGFLVAHICAIGISVLERVINFKVKPQDQLKWISSELMMTGKFQQEKNK